MSRIPLPRVARTVFLAASWSMLACTSENASTSTTTEPEAARLGKTSSSAVSLSSVAPDSGALSTTLDVKVNGNGFADGMVVIWQRSGVPDAAQIRTNSTRWVSSKQMIANITISSSAISGDWDVALYMGGKTGIGSEMAELKNGFKVTDPTATWKFPVDDASLSIQSDHLYQSGTSFDYVNGVCNLSTTIFMSTSTSSGDATLNTGSNGGKCSRRFRIRYPDGFAETVPLFSNLRQIAVRGSPIPIGATILRQLHMGSEVWGNVSSRCGGLVWGYGVAQNVGAGSDSVMVTRIDASTYRVASQPAPRNLAWCKKTSQLLPMSVDFTVVSSRPLP